MAMFIVKPWYRKKDDAIYGAEWAGTSDPSWVRTDAAVGFSAPNPYYAGMSTTPSSPFDNIMPWSGIRRVTDANAGELVEIPKFYYKWTRDGIKMKLQISMSAFDGSHVSPAHADRGDGVGERDYVYVGRYHCSTNDYKSTSGVKPKASITRPTARTAIHNLGSNVWQWDFALWWTINMLYLVEFANWNSQAMIGYNCGNNSSTENSGASDTMPYHTGTMKSNRTTYGVGCQYRYLEDLWGNVRDWLDGIYFVNDSNIYAIKNPSDFSDNTNGTLVGNCGTSYGLIKSWTTPTASGYEYALYPASYIDGVASSNSYVTDVIYEYTNSGPALFTGGNYEQVQEWGKFSLNKSAPSSWTSNNVGCRLMVLPPSRLSA